MNDGPGGERDSNLLAEGRHLGLCLSSVMRRLPSQGPTGRLFPFNLTGGITYSLFMNLNRIHVTFDGRKCVKGRRFDADNRTLSWLGGGLPDNK